MMPHQHHPEKSLAAPAETEKRGSHDLCFGEPRWWVIWLIQCTSKAYCAIWSGWSRYHFTVRSIPSSNESEGSQPSSRFIFVASIA